MLVPDRVHRVAPDVIGESLFADDARDGRSHLNPDSQLNTTKGRIGVGSHMLKHGESQLGDPYRVIGPFGIEASADHVRVTDRLDLFQATTVDQVVEGREEPSEHRDDLTCR
ncbi:MAG: hypothetical protein FJ095_19255 [Deltaproteobacteria bacterium]|nr:hypothetical protein [Deltaproteobacteria bacterium]